MVGWHHWLNGHEFEQTPGDSEGQGSLVCCSPWSCKELATIYRLNSNIKPRQQLVKRCYCVFVFRKPLWDNFWISSLTTLNPQIWISTGTNKKHKLLNIFKCYYGPGAEQRAFACVLYLNLPQTLICGHYCFFIWQGLKFKKTGFPGGSVVKNLPANAGDTGDMGSIPGSGRSPGEGNGNPLQYFLPGKSHEQRSLAGCGLWVAKNWTWLSEWRCTHKG